MTRLPPSIHTSIPPSHRPPLQPPPPDSTPAPRRSGALRAAMGREAEVNAPTLLLLSISPGFSFLSPSASFFCSPRPSASPSPLFRCALSPLLAAGRNSGGGWGGVFSFQPLLQKVFFFFFSPLLETGQERAAVPGAEGSPGRCGGGGRRLRGAPHQRRGEAAGTGSASQR